VTRVVFIENAAQAAALVADDAAAGAQALVAVTAEAVDALDSYGLPHTAADDICDLRRLAGQEYPMNIEVARLAAAFESFAVSRHPQLDSDGPGFMSAQAYPLFHASVAIAARALICLDAIRHFGASTIAVYAGELDPWFRDDGYAVSPSVEILRRMRPDIAIDVRPPAPGTPGDAARSPLHDRIRNRIEAVWRRVLQRDVAASGSTPPEELRGLTLLFPTGARYDWAQVADALAGYGGAQVFEIETQTLGTFWPQVFAPVVVDRRTGSRQALDVAAFEADADEERVVERLVDEWARTRPADAVFPVLGVDIFPGLLPHFTHVARRSPAMVRHADAIAAAALDAVRPDAVGFFAMPLLADKRFAHASRRRQVLVVCYQHGASYGTHQVAQHGQIEQAHADVFLSYGDGTRLHGYPEFPVRATPVPVGSARIDAIRRAAAPRRGPRQPLRVLWVGEYATRNEFNATHSIADVTRYRLEQRGLERLAAAHTLSVTYRPHRHQLQEVGIARWIERSELRIGIDAVRPLEVLIDRSDLIVTDASSGQVWYETLAIGRPMILFCDPRQTLLWPEFAADVERACLWCRDEESFLAVLDRLAESPRTVVDELAAFDARPFVEKYVLHTGAGRPVDRVLAFLASVHVAH
jgi:hypothetical protein